MTTPFVLPLEEQATLTILLSQSHRHYHNINHVNDCLAELYSWMGERDLSMDQYDKWLTYAIWYHDIVYNPYAPSGINELQSANIFESKHTYNYYRTRKSRWFDIRFEPDSKTKWMLGVKYAIVYTGFHLYTYDFDHVDYDLWYNSTLTQLMLDIDLSGLGKDVSIFARNSLNIRKEYYNTSDMDVIRGRLKFFQELNKRESFYYTEYFKDLYHTQSKKNVETEIILLEDAIAMERPSSYFNYWIDAING